MSIVDMLTNKGYHLKHEGGGNYRIKGYAGLIVKDNCWYSHSNAKGGGITTLMAYLGEKWNIDEQKYKTTHAYPVRQATLSTEHLHKLDFRGRDYLLMRGIDRNIIDELAEKQHIMEDPRGYVSFIGYDEQGRVQCISNRAYRDWLDVQRYEMRGSDKRYTFSFPSPASTTDTCILCEGPVDALSIACLEHLKNRNGYFNTVKIATCGAPSSFLLPRIKSINPTTVFLAFDNDNAGDEMTYRTICILRKLPLKVVVARPRSSKDPNDLLKKVKDIA
jgi:hypothetical protein